MNTITCPKCHGDDTEKWSYGMYLCHECGHTFEYYDAEDQWTRDMVRAFESADKWSDKEGR